MIDDEEFKVHVVSSTRVKALLLDLCIADNKNMKSYFHTASK